MCVAAVTEELDLIHPTVIDDRSATERLVSDTKRSRRQTSSCLVMNVLCLTPNVQIL